jgi:hypothetical protein
MFDSEPELILQVDFCLVYVFEDSHWGHWHLQYRSRESGYDINRNRINDTTAKACKRKPQGDRIWTNVDLKRHGGVGGDLIVWRRRTCTSMRITAEDHIRVCLDSHSCNNDTVCTM